jgi:hypothetical protein
MTQIVFAPDRKEFSSGELWLLILTITVSGLLALMVLTT